MKRQTARDAASPRVTGRRPDVAIRSWLRLARVFQKIEQASLDDIRRAGLSMGQFDVLAQVGAAEGSTQQQVADALLVTKSNVCQLLGRMERSGLIDRQQCGRTNRLYLTPDGRRLYDRLIPSHERKLDDLFSALSIDEQSDLLGLLRKLDHALP